MKNIDRLILTVAFLTGSTVVGQDMPLSQVLNEGDNWEVVGSGYNYTEGPAVDPDGNVYFSDVPNSVIYRIDIARKVSEFAKDTQRTNGLMFGPKGLYGCRMADRQIVVYSKDGKTVTPIATDVDCNDLVVNSKGEVYFTDPKAEQVWFIDAGGNKKVVAKGFRPNGIILWPMEGTLVVTDYSEPHLWTFRVEADGTLSNRERYYLPLQVPSGADRPGSDGMTVDHAGRLYVATAAGIQMWDPTGRLGGTIARPEGIKPSNVVFGGADFNYLYATCKGKVFRRKTKSKGVPYFQLSKSGRK